MVYLNNAVVWIVSIRHPIYDSSSSLSKPFGTVPSAPIIIILFLWGFSIPALAVGFQQEFEVQQFSLSLQDSSQYSGRSQQFSSFEGLDSFFDFQYFQSLFQALARSTYLSLFSLSFCHSGLLTDSKIHYTATSLFFLSIIVRPGLLVICLNLKTQQNFMCLILKDGFWFVRAPIVHMAKF